MATIKINQLSVIQAEIQLKEQKEISGKMGDLLNVLGTDIYYLLKGYDKEYPYTK